MLSPLQKLNKSYVLISHYLKFSLQKLEAVAEITSGHPSVRGIVTFKEKKDGWVEVKGKMYGLSPGGHGIHIHNSGDVSDSCAHIGDHFDPYNVRIQSFNYKN